MQQEEEMVEVQFNPEKAGSGLFEEPQPVLKQRAAVILVQRDNFLVGLWEEDCFIHPANQEILADEAERAVRRAFPTEEFASNALRVFTCPEALATRFDWNWK